MGRVSQPSLSPGGGPSRLRSATAHVGVAAPAAPAHASMPTPDELNEWMRAVGHDSDRTAFAALFRHFAPRIKAYLARTGSSEEQAEELAQETMVALWRRASSFDPQRAQLSTWLYTIARNLRIDHLRRAAGSADSDIEEVETEELRDDDQLSPDEHLHAAQRERSVRRALEALPREQALVLRLSFYEEHAHAAIAEALRIPLGTVKSRIRLAVTQLRRHLDGLEP